MLGRYGKIFALGHRAACARSGRAAEPLRPVTKGFPGWHKKRLAETAFGD